MPRTSDRMPSQQARISTAPRRQSLWPLYWRGPCSLFQAMPARLRPKVIQKYE